VTEKGTEPERPTQKAKHPTEPKKQTDRSRHMAWAYDDVEHHGPHDSEGTGNLKSFNVWKNDQS
jgi:hypothetical protein